MSNCTIIDDGGEVSPVFIGESLDRPRSFVNTIIMTADGVAPIELEDASYNPVSYCLLSHPWPGEGNEVGDPMFVDVDAGDVRLRAGSPAIDAGHGWRRNVGVWLDADQQPRFVDDPATRDRGISVEGRPIVRSRRVSSFVPTR